MSDTSVFHVTTAAELAAALGDAVGGETIVLQEGDYGALSLRGRAFSETVTIQSATPQTASFDRLDLNGVTNLAIESVVFDYTFEGEAIFTAPFRIVGSEEIAISDSLFDGDNRNEPDSNAHGYATGRGLMIGFSQNVIVEESEFRTFWKGVGIGNSEHVTFRGNEVHDMRTDGLNSTRSAHVTIENNHFHSMRVNKASGDHPDFIQIYSQDEGRIPHDFVIRGNHINIGDGDVAHAIFFHHGPSAIRAFGDEVMFENITISDNVIVNRQPHGITLNRTEGATITNNTLLAPVEMGGHEPRINIATDSKNVVLKRNVAETITGGTMAGEPGWQVNDNFLVQHDFPDLPDYYADHFINPLTDATRALENLQVLPDSPIAQAGAGASMLVYDDTPEGLVALARATRPDHDNVLVFDGTFSAGPGGRAEENGATFHWAFGDGSEADGAVVTHNYAEPGRYVATLTVTMPDGGTETTTVRIDVRGADLMHFDAERGGFLEEAYGTENLLDPGDLVVEDGVAVFMSDTQMKWDSFDEAVFSGAESLTVKARLQAESGGGLLNIHQTFKIAINRDGGLTATIAGTQLTSKGVDLTDGAWHDIAVHYDSRVGVYILHIDGRTVAETAVTAPLSNAGYDLEIGAPRWDSGGFTGRLETFEIDLNPSRYAAVPTPEAGPREPGWDETSLPGSDDDRMADATISFDTGAVTTYDSRQDTAGGTATVSDGGRTLTLAGNAWKEFDLAAPFEVQADSVLQVTFSSDKVPEIAAIGLDNDADWKNGNPIFQLGGTQSAPRQFQQADDYQTGDGMVTYNLDLSSWQGETYTSLTFVNDQDARGNGTPSSASFSDVSFANASGQDHAVGSLRTNLGTLAAFTSQDRGSAQVLADGSALQLTGNAWKAIDGAFSIREDTTLRFTFDSAEDAEMQAIGLARNEVYDAATVFEVASEDHWSLVRISDVPYIHGTGPRDYVFAVGEALAAKGRLGDYDQLVFLNDDDTPRDGEVSVAVWSDISIA